MFLTFNKQITDLTSHAVDIILISFTHIYDLLSEYEMKFIFNLVLQTYNILNNDINHDYFFQH